MPTNTCRRKARTRKLSLGVHHCHHNWFMQESSMNATTNRGKFDEKKGYLHNLKFCPHKIFACRLPGQIASVLSF